MRSIENSVTERVHGFLPLKKNGVDPRMGSKTTHISNINLLTNVNGTKEEFDGDI
ncbi:uncharacterized protein G2W53_023557 [Senna tora]|uniref:Uncharacterized protein n=1 Tax=Senna tora TaxID=362788 RepID=A0A834TC06_9FABA|nr:uncharacterized protein G2W53_023557 [Senna tora]